MSQGNCVEHINLNKTLYRAAECPHCKIILLERLLTDEQEDSQLQRKIKNANWERAIKAESRIKKMEMLLKDSVQFCLLKDMDGDPLNIHLAREINTLLAESV